MYKVMGSMMSFQNLGNPIFQEAYTSYIMHDLG